MKFITICLMMLSFNVLAEGLKTVNYNDVTSDKVNQPGQESAPSISPEQMRKLQEDITVLKKNQEESRKILEELDNEDN